MLVVDLFIAPLRCLTQTELVVGLEADEEGVAITVGGRLVDSLTHCICCSMIVNRSVEARGRLQVHRLVNLLLFIFGEGLFRDEARQFELVCVRFGDNHLLLENLLL